MASTRELDAMTVDELRKRAADAGIGGRSRMRKDELIDVLKGARGRGGGSGPRSSGSSGRSSRSRKDTGRDEATKYSQEITSPQEHEEREGRSLVTTEPDVIHRWADERGAVPATVEGTEHGERLGVLRFIFDDEGNDRLREVSWDEWFRTFDERNLRFIFQEHRSDGRESNFFRLENPDREDA